MSPFLKHLLLYCSFQLLNTVLHVLFLSIVSFFHFLLDHRMADIQDWVYFHSWEILSLCKILSLVTVTRFTGLYSSERNPFLHLLRDKRGDLNKNVLTACFAVLVGLYFVGQPKATHLMSIEAIHYLTSGLGTFIFFLTEILVVMAINTDREVSDRYWSYEIILFSLISFLVHKYFFLFNSKWEPATILFLMFCFWLLRLSRKFLWINSVIPVLFIAVPSFAFFGLDPLWGDQYALFRFSYRGTFLEYFVFFGLAAFYLHRRRVSPHS